jgi:hypothetical protein
VQIVEWYDELVRLTDSPVARLNRAVAVGEAALAALDPALPRHTAAAAYMRERDGDPVTGLYAEAARSAPSLPARDRPRGSTRNCAVERRAPAFARQTLITTTVRDPAHWLVPGAVIGNRHSGPDRAVPGDHP